MARGLLPLRGEAESVPILGRGIAQAGCALGGPAGDNCLVDCYNAVSLAYRLPIRDEDVDRVAGAVVLRFADGSELFDLPGPDREAAPPMPGEVVWANAAGVTCRCWNWRQGVRTRLTETTVNAYFLIEALAPAGRADLDAAAAELFAHLDAVRAGGEIERLALGASGT